MKKGLKTIAVMPTYNEERGLRKLIEETKKHVNEVIAVIDGSEDKSLIEAKKTGALVLKNEINMGLGFTLKRGAEEAVRIGADVIVTIDSDGQHDPAEIPKLVEELEKGKLDVVIGSRPHDENMPNIKKFGNWFLSNLSKLFFGIYIEDTQSGFKAFTPEAFERMKWKSDRYAVCSEIVMRIGRGKLKYKEVPVKTIYDDKHKTNITDVIDGIKMGLNMIRWKVCRS